MKPLRHFDAPAANDRGEADIRPGDVFRVAGRRCCMRVAAMIAEAELDRSIGRLRLSGVEYLVLALGEETAPGAGLPAPSELLTPREQQVVAMICEGHGNKRIADRLDLSEWTVSSYVRRIFAKLDVHTRAAMIGRVAETRPLGPVAGSGRRTPSRG